MLPMGLGAEDAVSGSVGAVFGRISGRLRRSFERWRGCRDGVTALEFTMLAPMLFLLISAIIEISLITFASGTLRTGVSNAARLIRTGQAQCATDEEIVAAICERAGFLPRCLNRLTIERTVFPVGFGGEGVADGPIHPSDIVLVGATYHWQITTPSLQPFFADGNGDFNFRQSFVFKTEEFVSESCS